MLDGTRHREEEELRVDGLRDEVVGADADRADLAALSEQVIQAQTSVGARAARVDLQAGYFATAALEREDTRSGLEDADPAQAITDLKRAMTILEATQASFGKLSQMSLFDYIR
mgnify:CR=1 FL=1